MKVLKAESEPQRRQCAYNLFTENSTQNGLDSKFDDDKPFYPNSDPRDSINIKLGDIFPRRVLPETDPLTAETITLTMSEMRSLVKNAESQQLMCDTWERGISVQPTKRVPYSELSSAAKRALKVKREAQQPLMSSLSE